MPKDKPNTIVFSCRGDVRDFAVLGLWLNDRGVPASSIAGLARSIISLFADTIRKKHPDLPDMSTADALKQLKILGLGSIGKRNLHTLVSQLQAEDFEAEMGDPSFSPSVADVSDVESVMIHTKQREIEEKEKRKALARINLNLSQGGTADGKDGDTGENSS